MHRGSGFSSLHPALGFAYFVAVIVFAMVFRHPVYLGSILAAAIALNLLLDGGRELGRNARWYLLMAAVIVVFNPLFSGRGATVWFYLADRPITLESTVYGVLFALALLGILVAFLAYNRVIDSQRFLYLFGSVAPKSAFIVTVTMRFMPLLGRRLREIIEVAGVMGGTGGDKSRWQRAREAMEMVNTLVTWSLEASVQTAISMRARGYGCGPRSSAVDYRLEPRDRAWLALMVLAAAATLAGLLLGYGQFEPFPRLDPVLPVATWHLAAFFVFLGLPIYLEGRELLQWRFIRWKT